MVTEYINHFVIAVMLFILSVFALSTSQNNDKVQEVIDAVKKRVEVYIQSLNLEKETKDRRESVGGENGETKERSAQVTGEETAAGEKESEKQEQDPSNNDEGQKEENEGSSGEPSPEEATVEDDSEFKEKGYQPQVDINEPLFSSGSRLSWNK